MESQPEITVSTPPENKEEKEHLFAKLGSKVESIVQTAADIFIDTPKLTYYILKNAPKLNIPDKPFKVAFAGRKFSKNPVKDRLTFKDNRGKTYSLIITPSSPVGDEQIKKGHGTTLIYIQGIDAKYGSEDSIGNFSVVVSPGSNPYPPPT